MRFPKPFGELAEALLVPLTIMHTLISARPCVGAIAFDYLVGTTHRFWRLQVKPSTRMLANKMYQVGVRHVKNPAPTSLGPIHPTRSTVLPSTSCKKIPGTSSPSKSSTAG